MGKDVLDCGGRLVNRVRFTPDGRWLIGGGGRFGGPPACILAWELPSGELRHQSEVEKDTVCALELFPGGRSAAWSSWFDDEVRLWGLPSLKPLAAMPLFAFDAPRPSSGVSEKTTVVGGLSISPDGTFLAAGCWDLTVKLWDVQSGALRQFQPSHKNNVDFVGFTDDGQTLVSGTADVLAWWSVKSGEQIATKELRGQPEWKHALAPNGRQLVSVGNRGAICLWDLADQSHRQFTAAFKDQVVALAFAPDGTELAIALDDGRVFFWNIAACKVRKKWRLEHSIKSIAFSPDGKLLACAECPPAPKGLVRLYSVEDSVT